MELLPGALAEIAVRVPPPITTNAEIYRDDLQWDDEADTEQEAARAFFDMAHVLRDIIQIDMCADLAYDRAAVVAAAPWDRRSDMLASSVCCHDAGGVEVVAAQNLVIDFAAERPRAASAVKPSALRRKRLVKAGRRAARTAILRRHWPVVASTRPNACLPVTSGRPKTYA